MLFHLVVLLSLSWPHVIGTTDADLRSKALDQIATASENVARDRGKSEEKQNFRDQLITSIIDTTVHYENSNGFVPMTVSSTSKPSNLLDQPDAPGNVTWSNSLNEPSNSTTIDNSDEVADVREIDEFENDPAYSTEARIFLNYPRLSTNNRRSFEFHERQNDFELLKVKNNTPTVASYPDFYVDPSTVDNGDQKTQASSGHRNTAKGKKLENFVGIYGTVLTNNNNGNPSYDDYYSHNSARDKGKTGREQEKVVNYHQQNVLNYDGHGQTATGQTAPGQTALGQTALGQTPPGQTAPGQTAPGQIAPGQTAPGQTAPGQTAPGQTAPGQTAPGQISPGQNVPRAPSFPRTNQEINSLAKNGAKDYNDAYDSVAAPSENANNHQMFSRPVVVAEPTYKFDQSLVMSDSGNDDYQTSRIIDSTSSEVSHRFTMHNRDGRFRSDEDSRDMSDDGEYVEYTERPRRLQKGRRRPSNGDSSRRLPKEHRGSIDDSMEYESQGKRHHSSRNKSHRQRVRGNSWVDDDRHHDQDDSYEESRYDGRLSGSETKHSRAQQSSKFKPSNTWNQISPNLEISHSSGIEIGQLEKPKLIVPVKVNLVPVANFDHATAIGNSQGFDMSNAVLQNIVSATPVSTLSTPTLMSTAANSIGQDAKFRVSTAVPDIVVGQNSFQNSMQAIFPPINDQSKFSTNLKPQYVSSTVAPIYAVTPNSNPSLQSIPIQDIQGTITPRPTYLQQMQQLSTSHMQGNIPQLIVPQPTLQTLPTLVQTPGHSGPDFNIQVNPHGMHGQNLVNHGNLQVQSMPTVSTVTPTPQTIPVTKINLVTAESQSKKTLFPGSTANFLASATMSVGQGDQRQTLNSNPYYLQNQNTQQLAKPQLQGGLYQQVLKNVNIAPKTKTYIQTTHLLPAVLQPMPTLTTFTATTPQVFPDQQNVQGGNFMLQPPRDQSQQFVKITNTGIDNVSTLRNMPSLTYQTIDNVGSHSTSNVNTLNAFPGAQGTAENAHLPYVGTRNVEIVNPNIKPSPVDTTVINSYETMHYPTAVFTTPFPMFTTTSVVTTRPAMLSTTTDSTNVQNFLNSFSELGSKNNQPTASDMKAYQSQDRPMFNPINFVPNIDVVKNQNALNSKLQASEPLQQNLNLVPLIPGGNFFKPSIAAQSELVVKPKLNSDLENYAEQMFKESLKTIYNSQKWNNDRRPGNFRQNASESTDIAKLKNELQRLKASLSDSKRNKDHEGHYSETKVQTAELPNKKPDELLAALEHMLKTHPSDPLHLHHGSNRPHRHRRPGDQDKFTFGPNNDFRDTKHVRDFMKPPQPGRSKGHFHEKPGKKRPMSGPTRYNSQNHYHGPRTYPRHNLSPKSGSIETSATNGDTIHAESLHYENVHNSRNKLHSEYRKGSSSFDSYPSLTTSLPDKNGFHKGSKHHNREKDHGYNHPRMHNFLGLLMKNKQLPNGSTPNYFQDKDQLKQYFESDKRSQQQVYDDTLKDYFYKMSDGMMYSNIGHTGPDARRYLTKKSTV